MVSLPADALELALLQDAQELDLHVHRDVAALVEEERAAVGELEAPGPPRHRAGEGALLVPEQLRLEHAGRQRGAVHAHERLLLARRVDVDGVGDQLLAGAGLAAQQHRRVRRRHLLHLLEHLAQRRRVADDLAEVELAVHLLREVAGVLLELLDCRRALSRRSVEALDRLREHALHFLGVPRLGDVAVHVAEVDRLDQHVDVGEGGEDDADGVGAHRARRLEELEARHLRHALVGDDHRHVVLFEERERLVAGAGRMDLEDALEVEAEGVEVVRLVVDDQYREGAQIGRQHDGDVTSFIDKKKAATQNRPTMESAEAVAAKRRVLIDALMMCLSKSRVMTVVDATTTRGVLDSASSEMWREGEFRLDPVWKILTAQPGLSAEDVAPPLLVFKAYEKELGVSVRVPQALTAIPRGEQIRLRDALGIERADFAKSIEEMRELAAVEANARQTQNLARAAEAKEEPRKPAAGKSAAGRSATGRSRPIRRWRQCSAPRRSAPSSSASGSPCATPRPASRSATWRRRCSSPTGARSARR